jgi:hypothetical protein
MTAFGARRQGVDGRTLGPRISARAPHRDMCWPEASILMVPAAWSSKPRHTDPTACGLPTVWRDVVTASGPTRLEQFPAVA